MAEHPDFTDTLRRIASLPEPCSKSRVRVDIIGVKRVYSQGPGVQVSTFIRSGSDRVNFLAVTPASGTMFVPGDIAFIVARAVLGEEEGGEGHYYDIQLVSPDGSKVAGGRDIVLDGKEYEFRLEATPDTVRLYPPGHLALASDARTQLISRLESVCNHYIIFNPAA